MEQSKEWTPVNEVEWFKKCSKCKDVKSLSEFAKDKNRLDGYSYTCKSCKKAYRNANKDKSKAYYQANKERIKEKVKAYEESNKDKRKEYREANKEHTAERQKEWRDANKEKIKAYYQDNKDKVKAKVKAYREANKDKIKAYREANKDNTAERQKEWREANKEKVKAYYQDNKDKVLERQRIYESKKRKEDAIYRLKNNLRSRLYSAIKSKGYSKNTKTAGTLGCSWEFLKEYLEAQFVDGMSWDNYGEWHIDHIKPLALAETEEDVYNLNHYTNLQPLWAEDNMRKKDNIDFKQFRLL